VIVVVRTSTSAFIALSAVCTHQGFEVNLPANGIIVCPGHGSRFNASTGAVVQGPAGTALPKFTATYDVNAQTVTIG
jgi:thiosulfate dehydrogenase [quinone] large subunit